MITVRLLLSIMIGVLLIGMSSWGESSQELYHEVKQIITYDQYGKLALLMGRQEGSRVEFFSIPIYDVEKAEIFSLRMVPKSLGSDVLEIAGSGIGSDARLLALTNLKRVAVFKVTPMPTGTVSFKELSTPEKVIEDKRGIERLRATDTSVFLQYGAKEINILAARDLQNTQRILTPDAIVDFMVDRDRIWVYASPSLRCFDLQAKPINQLAVAQLVRWGVFEVGSFIQTDEKTLLLLDHNCNRTAEIKTERPVRGAAASSNTIGVLSGSQATLFSVQGRAVGVVNGDFERLAASPSRFFLHKGQEIQVIDAKDAKLIKTIQLRNRLLHLVGLKRGLFIVLREVAAPQRLIYGFYDENGNLITSGYLPTIEGDRP